MKIFIALLFTCLSVNSAFAAIYHGIFTGTVDNLSEFSPFNNGDSFTVRFEIDTTSGSPLFVGLDIEGTTGTFGNTSVGILDSFSGTEDSFSMISVLDSPDGIFDGSPNSNISLAFIGGTEVFSGNDLAQSFFHTDFNSLTGSFDADAAGYGGDLLITSGAYLPGSLPSVPIPAAVWLFGSGLLGLIGFARRKKA